MNGDAVVAEGNGAKNRLAGQGAATAPQPVFQSFNAKNWAAAGISGAGVGLTTEVAGQLFVAGGFAAGFLLQPHLFAQSIGDLMHRDAAKPEGGQQVIDPGQVAAAGHPQDWVAAEQGVKAITAQLPLQHFAAARDVFVAVAALVPLANALACRWCGDEIQPVQAGVSGLGGNDLNEVAVLQWCGERAEPIVDAHALAVVPHLAVNAVGKVHGGGPLAQADHIAIGGEHKHLVIKEVFFDRAQIVVVVLAPFFFLPINQLPEPVEAGHLIAVSR